MEVCAAIRGFRHRRGHTWKVFAGMPVCRERCGSIVHHFLTVRFVRSRRGRGSAQFVGERVLPRWRSYNLDEVRVMCITFDPPNRVVNLSFYFAYSDRFFVPFHGGAQSDDRASRLIRVHRQSEVDGRSWIILTRRSWSQVSFGQHFEENGSRTILEVVVRLAAYGAGSARIGRTPTGLGLGCCKRF